MRKYYIFMIKREYYDIYMKNNKILYQTLKTLSNISVDNSTYGLELYTQICDLFDTKRLKSYFDNINSRHIKNKYIVDFCNQTTTFYIRKSCLVCITDNNIPSILRVLTYYYSYLFVCDFENEDYFFLNRHSISPTKSLYFVN
jgi:hypothetical protein